MKIKSDDWIFVTGKANSGKTFWVKEHLRAIAREIRGENSLLIFDYNVNDYQEFIPLKSIGVWNNQSGLVKETDEFIEMVYKKGNCFVVLEEADNYLNAPSVVCERFVNTARNRGIGCVVIGKRAKAVKPIYRTRFNYLVLFRNTLPDDIEYLEEWAGTGKGSLKELRKLEQGEHLIVNLDTGEIEKHAPI